MDSNNNKKASLGDDPNAKNEFSRLILKLQKALSDYGIQREAFSELMFFDKLESGQKDEIIKALQSYCGVIDNIERFDLDKDMEEDLKFIWSALKTYSLIPPANFLDTYKKGYLFEIYDSQGRQIFRNFEFFRVCSYTLEEIFCRPWFELYTRDEEVTQEIMNIGQQIFTGQVQNIVYSPIKPHVLKEIASEALNEATIDIKSFVPLTFRDSGEKCAAVIEKCDNLVSNNKIRNPLKSTKEDYEQAQHLRLV